MKAIIAYVILFMFIVAVGAFAEEAPAYMKDGVITVTLKSGKVYTYSTNEWMVVRRGAKKLVDAPLNTIADQRHFAQPEHNKNRVRLMGGFGPVGIQDEVTASRVKITTKYGLVGGLGYDRSLSNKFSLGVAGYTNGTFSLGAGLDF